MGFELARVADASHAAEAGQVETEGREVAQQIGIAQVVRHHQGARGERGLHPGLAGEATFARPSRQETCLDHLARVGSVGAAGDGGDGNGAMGQRLAEARLEVVRRRGGTRDQTDVRIDWHLSPKGVCGSGQGLPLVRLVRTGHAGLDTGEVQVDDLCELGFGVVVVTPEGLGLQISGDALTQLRRAAGELEVLHGHRIEGEEHHGRPVFRCHVGQGAAYGPTQARQARSAELDELAYHAALTQQLGDFQGKVSGGHPRTQCVGHADTDDLGKADRYRFAQHGRLAFQTAHAPTEDADGVDHRRMAVRRHHAVGMQLRYLFPRVHRDDLRDRLQVHQVNNAGAGRDHAEVIKTLLRPANKAIALGVAAKVKLQILLQRIGGGVAFDDNRVIDSQHRRNMRIDALRIAAEFSGEIAHRRKVRQRRQTGGVVKHQAVGIKGDFPRGLFALQHTQKSGQRLRRAQRDVLQQNAQAERQTLQLPERQQLGQIEKLIGAAINDQGRAFQR